MTDTNYNHLVLDAGNSDLKGYVNGRRFSVATNYKVNIGHDVRKGKGRYAPFDGSFTVFDYNNNPRRKQFTFGRGAEGGNMPANSDKRDFYKLFVQGCCGGTVNDAPWHIVVSHWDEYFDDDVIKMLKGKHSVCVNGVDTEFTVKKVEFCAEGEGANLLYRKDGGGTLGVFDIGYDTIGLHLADESGVLDHKYMSGHGVRIPIAQIWNSPELAERVSTIPSSRSIIYAIQNNGQLIDNGVEMGVVDISDLIETAVQEWVADTFGKIDHDYGEMMNQASAYWMIGGGANLVRQFVEGQNIFIPNEPEFTNVEGMRLKIHGK